MPYRQANYFVGFTLLVIIVGFWGSYIAPIATVRHEFHVHAVTATSWVVLLMVQHWAIHSGRRSLHRLAGKFSLFMFPFLIVGFVMIINVSAEAYAANASPTARFLGPSFALSMLFAIVAYLILYYQALRNRRDVRLHAGYMLTTPLVLFESPFSRVVDNYLPFLVFTNSEFPQRLLDTIVISMAMAIAFAAVMYLRDRKHGVPFLVAAILMLLQAVSMYVGTSIEWVRQGFAGYATLPVASTLVVGFLLGLAVSWLGWRPIRRAAPPTTPAPVAS